MRTKGVFDPVWHAHDDIWTDNELTSDCELLPDEGITSNQRAIFLSKFGVINQAVELSKNSK